MSHPEFHTNAQPPYGRSGSLGKPLRKALAGFGLGWIWSSMLSLASIGLGAIIINSFDERTLRAYVDPAGTTIFMGCYVTSVIAAWAGSTTGPLAVESGVRVRGPIVIGSVCGALGSAVTGAIVGGFAAWVTSVAIPDDYDAVIWVVLLLGLPVGLPGGWVGGRLVRHLR